MPIKYEDCVGKNALKNLVVETICPTLDIELVDSFAHYPEHSYTYKPRGDSHFSSITGLGKLEKVLKEIYEPLGWVVGSVQPDCRGQDCISGGIVFRGKNNNALSNR